MEDYTRIGKGSSGFTTQNMNLSSALLHPCQDHFLAFMTRRVVFVKHLICSYSSQFVLTFRSLEHLIGTPICLMEFKRGFVVV